MLERSGTLGATPALAGALNDGSITPGHVDAVTKAAKGLEGQQRAELMRRADGLVGLAAAASVGDFRKRLEHEARSIQRDDGMAKFERQKAAVRLRRWTDADGMWCLQGRFDPLTGVKLNARLVAEIEALPKDTALAFLCQSGARSAQAAEHFRALGFKELYNVAGGIAAWSRDVDPSIPQY